MGRVPATGAYKHSGHDEATPRSAIIRAERTVTRLSTRQAQRLGRLGGKVSAADRKGNSQWGRRMQRKRAARARKQHYPELSKEWARNANRARWGKPLPDVMGLMRPPASEVRVWRANDEQA